MNRDGEILRSWKFLDILDPYRLGYDSLQPGFWMAVYKDTLKPPGKDWSHGNSIVYDEVAMGRAAYDLLKSRARGVVRRLPGRLETHGSVTAPA